MKNFVELTTITDDPRFGDLTIMFDPADPETRLMRKTKQSESLEEHQQTLEQAFSRQAINHPNILRLAEIEEDPDSLTASVYFEFPDSTLDFTALTIGELVLMFHDILTAVVYLQEHKMIHGDIRSDYITFCPRERVYKLLDRLGDFSNPIQCQFNNINNYRALFMAPVIFNELMKKSQRIKQNSFKSECFALGMNALSFFVQPETIQEMYDFDREVFNEELFEATKADLAERAFDPKEKAFLAFLIGSVLLADEAERLTPQNALEGFLQVKALQEIVLRRAEDNQVFEQEAKGFELEQAKGPISKTLHYNPFEFIDQEMSKKASNFIKAELHNDMKEVKSKADEFESHVNTTAKEIEPKGKTQILQSQVSDLDINKYIISNPQNITNIKNALSQSQGKFTSKNEQSQNQTGVREHSQQKEGLASFANQNAEISQVKQISPSISILEKEISEKKLNVFQPNPLNPQTKISSQDQSQINHKQPQQPSKSLSKQSSLPLPAKLSSFHPSNSQSLPLDPYGPAPSPSLSAPELEKSAPLYHKASSLQFDWQPQKAPKVGFPSFPPLGAFSPFSPYEMGFATPNLPLYPSQFPIHQEQLPSFALGQDQMLHNDSEEDMASYLHSIGINADAEAVELPIEDRIRNINSQLGISAEELIYREFGSREKTSETHFEGKKQRIKLSEFLRETTKMERDTVNSRATVTPVLGHGSENVADNKIEGPRQLLDPSSANQKRISITNRTFRPFDELPRQENTKNVKQNDEISEQNGPKVQRQSHKILLNQPIVLINKASESKKEVQASLLKKSSPARPKALQSTAPENYFLQVSRNLKVQTKVSGQTKNTTQNEISTMQKNKRSNEIETTHQYAISNQKTTPNSNAQTNNRGKTAVITNLKKFAEECQIDFDSLEQKNPKLRSKSPMLVPCKKELTKISQTTANDDQKISPTLGRPSNSKSPSNDKIDPVNPPKPAAKEIIPAENLKSEYRPENLSKEVSKQLVNQLIGRKDSAPLSEHSPSSLIPPEHKFEARTISYLALDNESLAKNDRQIFQEQPKEKKEAAESPLKNVKPTSSEFQSQRSVTPNQKYLKVVPGKNQTAKVEVLVAKDAPLSALQSPEILGKRMNSEISPINQNNLIPEKEFFPKRNENFPVIPPMNIQGLASPIQTTMLEANNIYVQLPSDRRQSGSDGFLPSDPKKQTTAKNLINVNPETGPHKFVPVLSQTQLADLGSLRSQKGSFRTEIPQPFYSNATTPRKLGVVAPITPFFPSPQRPVLYGQQQKLLILPQEVKDLPNIYTNPKQSSEQFPQKNILQTQIQNPLQNEPTKFQLEKEYHFYEDQLVQSPTLKTQKAPLDNHFNVYRNQPSPVLEQKSFFPPPSLPSYGQPPNLVIIERQAEKPVRTSNPSKQQVGQEASHFVPLLYQPTVQTPLKIVTSPNRFSHQPSIRENNNFGSNTLWMNAQIPGHSVRSIPSQPFPGNLPPKHVFRPNSTRQQEHYDYNLYQPRYQ